MLTSVRNILWGPATVFLIITAGIVLMFKTKFRALKNPVKTLKETLFSKNSSSFKSMCTALGGTIGVGNTVGVAAAIIEGGPGALFWMLIASVFGMVIKESEIFLAVKFKPLLGDFSGPMYYIEKGLSSKFVAHLWAMSCVICAFGMGNISQSMAACESFERVFLFPKSIMGVIFSVFVFLVLSGGLGRIKNCASSIIPIISIMFVILSCVIIFLQRENLAFAVKSIFSSVFSLSSGTVGVKWAVFASAIRAGFSRGIFSNEAGLGSASVVHSSSRETSPEKQARWGVIEVFIDTVIICTLTGLMILTSDIYTHGASVQNLTLGVFVSALGTFGGSFYALSMVLFAFASILAWFCYAECSLIYIGANQKERILFRAVFAASSFLGTVISADNILVISDIFNAVMMLVNITALLLLSNHAKTV